MTATYEDYDAAVKAFWAGRDLQTQKQVEAGKIDAGTRGAVTGGLHLNALQELIARELAPLADLGATVRKSGIIPLPGYYRRAKNWDIVVTYKDILVAAIECKSQVGSFGNNFNNRTEEAIGNAVDLWRAYEAGLVGKTKPWLGFVFVFERAAGSTAPSATRASHYTELTQSSIIPRIPLVIKYCFSAWSANGSTTRHVSSVRLMVKASMTNRCRRSPLAT
jgi:hypothetical protein